MMSHQLLWCQSSGAKPSVGLVTAVPTQALRRCPLRCDEREPRRQHVSKPQLQWKGCDDLVCTTCYVGRRVYLSTCARKQRAASTEQQQTAAVAGASRLPVFPVTMSDPFASRGGRMCLYSSSKRRKTDYRSTLVKCQHNTAQRDTHQTKQQECEQAASAQ